MYVKEESCGTAFGGNYYALTLYGRVIARVKWLLIYTPLNHLLLKRFPYAKERHGDFSGLILCRQLRSLEGLAPNDRSTTVTFTFI